eukprot:12887542-Prorocentrum_lima.AAC.1
MYFKKLVAPVRVVVIADTAYNSNEDKTDCLALRGYLVAVVGSLVSRRRCDRPAIGGAESLAIEN